MAVGGHEPLTVQIRHDHGGLVEIERLPQCRDRQSRWHRADAGPAERGPDGLVDHAASCPRAPRDAGRRQVAGAPPQRECVEIRVRRGVGPVTGASPDAGAGGEHHEGVEFASPEQLVQVARADDLRGQRVHQIGLGHLGDPARFGHSGGVEDRGHREGVQQFGQCATVGHVARDHIHPDPEIGELCGQFGRAAPATDQDQVFGARPSQPASDVRADATRATGDQHAASGPPLPVGHRAAALRADQPPHGDSGRTHGELLLGTDSGQHRDQVVGRLVVECPREIDQTAPPVRMLQADHPAQSPHLGLGRARQPLAAG